MRERGREMLPVKNKNAFRINRRRNRTALSRYYQLTVSIKRNETLFDIFFNIFFRVISSDTMMNSPDKHEDALYHLGRAHIERR